MQASPIRPCPVLNKSANVSEATRHKVEIHRVIAVCAESPAQQLVGKQSQTVGLVTISLALHAPSRWRQL